MKPPKIYLLLFIFGFMSLVNTAFVAHSTMDSTSVDLKKRVEKTPQYETPKLSFFEKIALKNVLRKVENWVKNTADDLDKLARQSDFFAGLTLFNALLTLFFIKISVIGFLLMLTLTLIAALITASKANHVEANPLSTDAQKKRVKRSKSVGCFGFLGLIFSLIALLFSLLS